MGGHLPNDNPARAFFARRSVCVTGGAGFIGGHLVEALLLLGARVTVIDDLFNSDGVHVSSLVESSGNQLRFVYGSILEPRALAEACDGAEVIFHLAALNSVPRSIEMPERTFEVNAIGTLRVAEAARRVGARRLVYAASSSAYGDDPTLPKVESLLPRPISPYGASKLAGESVVRAWNRSYGVPAASLRFFNVFGPRQPANDAYAGVIPAFMSRLLSGQRPIIYGDGSQTRDLTPVANVVHACLLAGSIEVDPGGEAFNIGLGRRTTILELAQILARLAGRPEVEPIFAPARAGDVPHSLADLSLARRVLGYEPVKSLEDGLADTAAWYARSRGASPAPV